MIRVNRDLLQDISSGEVRDFYADLDLLIVTNVGRYDIAITKGNVFNCLSLINWKDYIVDSIYVLGQKEFESTKKLLTEEDKTTENIETVTDSEIVNTIKNIVKAASAANSSDIHFISKHREVLIYFRVNSELKHYRSLDFDLASDVCAVLYNVLGGTKENSWSISLYQDTNVVLDVGVRSNSEIRLRYSHMPTTYNGNAGFHAVIRLLHSDSKAAMGKGIFGLGLEDTEEYDIKNRMLSRPSGLLIVSGVTGSGKSTTLKKLLEFVTAEKLRNRGCAITVEDPVEYAISAELRAH